eukprot:6174927-Pleurochrysis_carterae.AAC.2
MCDAMMVSGGCVDTTGMGRGFGRVAGWRIGRRERGERERLRCHRCNAWSFSISPFTFPRF